MQLVALLRRLNRAIAIVCGAVLLATALFVLVEIAMRALGASRIGGSDEVAGYVMAGVTAWGLSFALTERAHIRIDMAVRALRPLARDIIDALALTSIAAVALTVTVYGWRVFKRSLDGGSLANTPLETPLAWPQGVWWAGWGWFTVTALALAGVAWLLAIRRRSAELRAIANDPTGDAVTRADAAASGRSG